MFVTFILVFYIVYRYVWIVNTLNRLVSKMSAIPDSSKIKCVFTIITQSCQPFVGIAKTNNSSIFIEKL